MKDDEFKKRLRKVDKDLKLLEKTGQFVSDRQRMTNLVTEHLKPCGKDLILLTLKGHLIIENLLEMNLCRLLSIDCLPEKDNNPNLEFIQKLKLIQAVVVKHPPGPNADLFCAITKLNKTRNDLAHNLMSQTEVESAVKRIIESYQSKADLKLSSEKPLPVQLKACIVKLCNFLDTVRLHFLKLELQGED